MTTSGPGSRRPALVWDMGGILYRYFTEVLLDEHPQELAGVPFGPTSEVVDPAYRLMLTGQLHEHRYLDEVRERMAARGLDRDPTTTIDWSRQSRAESWAVVEAAHAAGHPQALLTNDASRWLGQDWQRTWPRRSWFDHLVDVRAVGVRKPAPEPYLAAARRLDLPPHECLFIDDLIVNCEGAEAVGMDSHHVDVRDPTGSMRLLWDRLGLGAEDPGPERPPDE